jgi:hypothetical protein
MSARMQIALAGHSSSRIRDAKLLGRACWQFSPSFFDAEGTFVGGGGTVRTDSL